MPNTTNFNWATPADTDLVKDGAAAIRTLGSSIDTSFVDLKGGTTGQVLTKASNTDLDFSFTTPTAQALNLISTTSLSAVSSQSVNNVFTSTYTNYVVILSTTATSAAGASFTMKLRVGGADSSVTYGAFIMGLNSAGTTINNTSSSTSWYLTESHSSTTAGYNYAVVTLINPALANATLVNIQSLGLTTAAGQYLASTGSGIHDTATAYDGFTIIRSSGTFTGAISVYGYSK